jgi:hypothetical protein
MGNILDCCCKKAPPQPDALSIEEVYESFSTNNDDCNWIDSILNRFFFGSEKRISWREQTREDIYRAYSNEEYDRSGYETLS